MKNLIFLSTILIVTALVVPVTTDAKPNAEDAVTGLWNTEPGDSRIEIYKKKGKYFGKIVWLKEPNENGKPKVDKSNTDKTLHKRPLIGLHLLNGFVYNDNNVWIDGEIFNPRAGKTYSCELTLLDDGKTLDVRGYVLGMTSLGKSLK